MYLILFIGSGHLVWKTNANETNRLGTILIYELAFEQPLHDRIASVRTLLVVDQVQNLCRCTSERGVELATPLVKTLYMAVEWPSKTSGAETRASIESQRALLRILPTTTAPFLQKLQTTQRNYATRVEAVADS